MNYIFIKIIMKAEIWNFNVCCTEDNFDDYLSMFFQFINSCNLELYRIFFKLDNFFKLMEKI
jgi:hypothetical protein